MAQIGIDVSKQKLDVCWLRDPDTLKVKTRVFSNTRAGFVQVLNWLEKQTQQPVNDLQIMMEATGIYHEGLAYALHEAGACVHVANPHHASEFRKSLGRRSKTDKKDAIVLARFLHSRPHHRWQPESPEVRHLKALLNRLAALDKDIRREENRQEKADIQQVSEPVRRSISTMIQALKEERRRLVRDIDDHFDNHPGLKQDRNLLESIPGIGSAISVEMTAVLRSRDFSRAGQVAAFLGLVPVTHESGSSVQGRPTMSKAGSSRVRAKLYMGAVVAVQHNHLIRRHYHRLVNRGKTKMSALGAAMRKLAQMAYGVLKHQTVYDPQWA